MIAYLEFFQSRRQDCASKILTQFIDLKRNKITKINMHYLFISKLI